MDTNMQALALIILVILGLILTFGIFFFVFLLGKRSVKNNPEKGLVFVKTGLQLLPPFKAKLVEKTKKGFLYLYDRNKFIMIPSKYKEVYFRGRLIIFVNKIGQLISSPFDDDEVLSENEKSSLIYELVSSRIGSQSIQALQGKAANIIMIAIIAFFIGAVIIYGFLKYQDTMKYKQTSQQQKIENPVSPPTNLPQPIEVK